MVKIVLFAVLILQGQEPKINQKEMESMDACIAEATALLKAQTPAGSTLSVGCAIGKPPEAPQK